jgi:hypothetical protein
MTRAILARDLKSGDIIKWNNSLMLVLTEEMGNNQTIVFRLLSGTKIKTQTFWKDVDLVNVYDPALVDLWQ